VLLDQLLVEVDPGDDQSGRKHEEIEISSNSSGESVLVKYDGSNDVGRRIRFQMQNWTK
jgi:hypothetical protein